MKKQTKPTHSKNKPENSGGKETPASHTDDTQQAGEQRMRIFLNSTSDMAFLKDENFRHIFANPALCKFYDKTESEVLGKTDFDLMDKKAAAACRETDEQTLRSNDLLISEEVVGGRCYETRKFPVEFEDGGKGVGAYIRDITERKQTEEAIIRAAREWQATFDSANDMIWLLDKEQRVVRCNKTSERFFQRPCGEFVGIHCWEIVHGTAAPIPECPLLRMKKSLSRENMEMQIGDGWFSVTVDPLLDASGNYNGAVHIIRDITERKKVEELLRLKNHVFDTSIAAKSIADVDGVITEANDSFLQVWGFSSKDEVVGNPISYFLNDLEEAVAIVNALNEHGRWQGNFTAKKKDGSTFIAHSMATAIRDANGKVTGYQSSVIDITEQKLAVEAVREKEIQYRNLADSGLALIWRSGTDKLCNYFNQPWLKFTGRTLEQEMGNGWTQGVHPDDFDSCLKTYVTAFDKRETFDMEYRLRHASGEYRWIRDLGTPNYNSNGEFIGYIGHCFDITEQKKAEDVIKKTQ